MIKKQVNQAQAIEIIGKLNSDNIHVFSDDYWAYPLDLPVNLRDARNSIMLDVMIKIEKHAGVLIYIPNKQIEDK